MLCVLGIVIGAVIMNIFFFYLVSWRHLLSGALLGLTGYTLGGGAALLARMEKPQVGNHVLLYSQTPKKQHISFVVKYKNYFLKNIFQIIAVAIETAIQNGGIAVVVLNLTFPR